MRTGILGGTFDPIHIAHLHAAETALSAANLDRVLFIPAGDPWQKAGQNVTDARRRVEMVRIAIEGVTEFDVDLREVERHGPSYTMDTLESFPEDQDLYLILGADAAADVGSWHQSEALKQRAKFLVVPRPGSDADAAAAVLPHAEVLEMAALDVSSTTIRTMAGEGRPFRYLVTAAVYDYIIANRLYID